MVNRKSFKAKLTSSGRGYWTEIKFPDTGKWRIRAIHGSGNAAVKSAYTDYKVIVDH